jgi:hypothetical protein
MHDRLRDGAGGLEAQFASAIVNLCRTVALLFRRIRRRPELPPSKYLTIVVQDKATLEWEVMIEDIRLDATRERELLDGIAEWTGKQEAVYPAKHWGAWTVVGASPGNWRTAFAEQNKADAPLSSVRLADRLAG